MKTQPNEQNIQQNLSLIAKFGRSIIYFYEKLNISPTSFEETLNQFIDSSHAADKSKHIAKLLCKFSLVILKKFDPNFSEILPPIELSDQEYYSILRLKNEKKNQLEAELIDVLNTCAVGFPKSLLLYHVLSLGIYIIYMGLLDELNINPAGNS